MMTEFEKMRSEEFYDFTSEECLTSYYRVKHMHIGDKWEVYIPAEMGYGKFSQPCIPGGSTLIFEIELLGKV